MPNYTPNIGLSLPLGSEYVSRTQINDNWSRIDEVIGTLPSGGTIQEEINGKVDKVDSSINGNFAGLDANGNITDSGKKASDFVAVTNIGTDAEFEEMINDYYGEVS